MPVCTPSPNPIDPSRSDIGTRRPCVLYHLREGSRPYPRSRWPIRSQIRADMHLNEIAKSRLSGSSRCATARRRPLREVRLRCPQVYAAGEPSAEVRGHRADARRAAGYAIFRVFAFSHRRPRARRTGPARPRKRAPDQRGARAGCAALRRPQEALQVRARGTLPTLSPHTRAARCGTRRSARARRNKTGSAPTAPHARWGELCRLAECSRPRET